MQDILPKLKKPQNTKEAIIERLMVVKGEVFSLLNELTDNNTYSKKTLQKIELFVKLEKRLKEIK